MSLNIYYAAAILNADDDSKRMAKAAIATLQQHGQVLTEHIGYDDVHSWEEENAKRGITVFERDIAWLNDSDVLVADISRASTGVGIEIMYALQTLHVPTLAIHGEHVRASSMVTQMRHPQLTVRSYASEEEMTRIMREYVTALDVPHAVDERTIEFDSIDGAGKGTLCGAIKGWGALHGKRIFDAIEYAQREGRNPTWDDACAAVPGCDMLIVGQPSCGGMGRIIRDELTRQLADRAYPAMVAAHGFAIDRDILDKTLVAPARKAGAWIVKERGEVTSEHYQPLQFGNEGYSREIGLGIVRGLPGNRGERQTVSGLLIVPQVDVEEAMRRLQCRDKKDDSIFEQRGFQEPLAQLYASGRVTRMHERHGAAVVQFRVPTGETPKETQERVVRIWEEYLARKGLRP